MRDIKVKILSNGAAQVDEPFCFCAEHNAARLCIELNDELKTDVSYYILSFDVYGLGRRVISNIINDAQSTPASVSGGVIYCPLSEALTSTGELSVQVEAHKREDKSVAKIVKSAVFTLNFEPSVMGCDSELDEKCGILPQLTAAIDKMTEFESFSDGITYTPSVSADGTLSWSNNGGRENPPSVNVKGEKGDKGDKGDTGARGEAFLYSDFTAEQLTALKGDKGEKGLKGDKGDKGTDGKTPVKGVDYWTAADQESIVADVLAALPDGDEVSY